MQFNFDKETVSNACIDIDEVGHCCIKGTNDLLEDYYLVIQTFAGKSLIFKYGPIVPDLEVLPNTVYCSIERIDYNEGKLKSIIDKFLNDYRIGIRYADTFTINDCLNSCVDLIEYTRNYKEKLYGTD